MNLTESADSTTISRFGYDTASHTLGVEFKNGTQYHYYDVPESMFEQMKSASSKGQFLAQSIKGAYRYARV